MWKEAGLFGLSYCQVAVAIALAGSGGDCDAKNINNDSHHSEDRGLWQINNYSLKEVSDSCAFNCRCNAQKAYSISNTGKNWSWSPQFKSEAYLSYLATAVTACEIPFASSDVVV